MMCCADCNSGDSRLVQQRDNHTVIIARNGMEVCQNMLEDGMVVAMSCREQWSDLFEGRVEVCGNNTFASVCDDRWDVLEARVVCRQLNSTSAGKNYVLSYKFGECQIWLSFVSKYQCLLFFRYFASKEILVSLWRRFWEHPLEQP